ncbi:hypothetical protein A5672_12300 [Mycobacterium alsense]|uniref:Uncharacterized protein n=1 Tax=Mycobacterium alsense TaxID=324058 RepID=A0ABD6P2Z8_9MYCO|nr:hypothetical protein [Mycobacterium alsense]OBG41697.1 hypothetical protein A5672_12300 [Mycobacterium alsense]OBI95076.1 hypothetical protein A5660_01120 [Mycobacterium alsense]
MEIAAGPSDVAVASLSTAAQSHADYGSTLNDDKAFKSGGLKRDRAPGFPTPAPRAAWTPTSPSPAAWPPRAGEPCCRVSAGVLAGQDLLAHLCVCRC